MAMTDTTPQPNAAPHDKRTHQRPGSRGVIWSGVCRLLVRLSGTVAVLAVSSASASAHEFGHGGGQGGTTTAFAVVVGLPIAAGLVGGLGAVRYRSLRGSEPTEGRSSLVGGLLLVGLGTASLLPAAAGHLWLSVAGGTVGAAIVRLIAGRGPISAVGCGNHAGITLGAISTHRLLEGIVLGTLYSAGAVVGLFGAVVIAGHTALETAAIGGLYATAPHRTWTVGAIVLVQAGYVVGVVAGLDIVGAVPVSVRTLTLAVVGGALVVVGANETKRSFTVSHTAGSIS